MVHSWVNVQQSCVISYSLLLSFFSFSFLKSFSSFTVKKKKSFIVGFYICWKNFFLNERILTLGLLGAKAQTQMIYGSFSVPGSESLRRCVLLDGVLLFFLYVFFSFIFFFKQSSSRTKQYLPSGKLTEGERAGKRCMGFWWWLSASI